MKLWSKENLSGAGIQVIALMTANLLNFAFNAFLGRRLSYEQFGILTFYNTILALAVIFFGGLSTAVNHRTAYLNGKYDEKAGSGFMLFVRSRGFTIGMAIVALWLAFTPVLAKLFQIQELWSLVLFSPVFVLGLIAFVNKGFLQGNLNFVSVALIILTEAFTKLLSAMALVFLGLNELVYLAVPFSLLAAFGLSMFFTSKNLRIPESKNEFRFPKRFFTAAVITGLSTAAFLSVDVILAKHFLSPVDAGEYALLSLVGKMVFFLGSILNGFMITFVSHDVGEKKGTRKTFYRLLSASVVLTSLGVLFFGYFGHLTIPLLLGDKVAPILGFLPMYTIAIGLFTIASVIIIYHLALEHYVFSFVALGLSALLAIGIFVKHSSIQDFTNIIFITSIASIIVMTILHLLQLNGKFILANLVDLLNIFLPLEKQKELENRGKRILIMNWRDMKHKYAGGAEVYVHELAKRWVRDGNQVTLFCGNDGTLPRNENIDEVRIVRRGGFYFVYFWAFLYYFTKFRGRFDVIIDCQNGIPFFTPLYAKETVYCVLFHVHQDVFFKFLPKPLATFASVLENRFMPYVYRNTKFITISESTKKDMEDIDLGGSGIEIVFPGVDLQSLEPAKKSLTPTVLYLGRLKSYKSVDVLINAFKQVVRNVSDAVLVIAGSGDEEQNLIKLAYNLNLSDRIDFRGKVTDEEKKRLMQEAWVFVNPSMREGWGITTIEAGACATPVVASDVPGLRDSVQNPHTGFLVPYGDAHAFAEKISLLLSDKALHRDMAEASVKWANNFDWDKSSRHFLSLLIA